jgi:PadR family transcriptional regulator, regulatory protein PadR
VFDNTHIGAYSAAVRRKPGELVPLEVAICLTASRWAATESQELHGYQLAKELARDAEPRLFVGYGTLYRALGRLEAMGLLSSRREDPAIAALENRPGRRFYSLTAAGQRAAAEAQRIAAESVVRRRQRRLAPA